MVFNKKDEVITKEFILSKISEYDIYRYYMPVSFSVGDIIKSPFTEQKTGSFGIYLCRKSSRLFYRDFDPDQHEYHGDCINFVMQYLQIQSMPDALYQIAKDFGLVDGTDKYKEIKKKYVQPVLDTRLKTLIHITAKPFDAHALEYWNRWDITKEQLERERIYSVSKWWINRRRQSIKPGERVFAYWFPTGYKILRPDRDKKEKWKTNIQKIVENIDLAPDYEKIVITKSRKDRMILTNCLPADILVTNTQNEGVGCFPKEYLHYLENKRVWIAFDTDLPGKEGSKLLQSQIPGSLHINVPDQFYEEQGITDWAELYEEYGASVILNHFKKKNVI